ncbi:Hypothetical predicted protein [Cloeon dipterum]|uniref:Uncharacterized protein n=1 Tax=Cloeon dipterum TaxID=197152 RepID=A0A8S1C1Q6_9INSE|nr:Hypothetical predicted protein [Cloeon dipterum]
MSGEDSSAPQKTPQPGSSQQDEGSSAPLGNEEQRSKNAQSEISDVGNMSGNAEATFQISIPLSYTLEVIKTIASSFAMLQQNANQDGIMSSRKRKPASHAKKTTKRAKMGLEDVCMDAELTDSENEGTADDSDEVACPERRHLCPTCASARKNKRRETEMSVNRRCTRSSRKK